MKIINFVILNFFILLCLSYNSSFFLNENLEFGYLPFKNQIKYSENEPKLFYWLFKSRTKLMNPPPLVIWLEGGPGCTQEKALFIQNGPYRLLENSTNFILNEFAWNNNADVLFVDQPLDTGFSVIQDKSKIPKTAYEAMENLYQFIKVFLEIHSEYAKRQTKIYLSGQSYAGHYIPALVDIMYKNKFESEYEIGGILIGNPYTDPKSLAESWPKFAFEKNLISEFTYYGAKVSTWLYKMLKSLNLLESAYTFYIFTLDIILGIETPRFLFTDIRGINMPIPYLQKLIYARIMSEIGVTNVTWKSCNAEISEKYMRIDHIDENYLELFKKMLDRKLKTVIYYGEYDFLCSIESAKLMLSKIPNIDNNVEEKLWMANGKIKGKYQKLSENLIYVNVYNSGHDVMFNEPEFGYDLLTKIMQNNLF